MIHKRVINVPGTEETCKHWQFSQAVRVGNTLYISGQVGESPTGEIPEDIARQARLAFSNLKRVVEQAGGTLDDVVELLTFHTDINELPQFVKVKSEFFSKDFPAWTAVGTTGLALPQLKLEIKSIAVIKE